MCQEGSSSVYWSQANSSPAYVSRTFNLTASADAFEAMRSIVMRMSVAPQRECSDISRFCSPMHLAVFHMSSSFSLE